MTFIKQNWLRLVIVAIILPLVYWVFFLTFLSGKRASVTLLPPYFFSDSVAGLVGASGTFTAKGERLANKFNTVTIDCFNHYGDTSFQSLRKSGTGPGEAYCYIAQADVIDGYLSSDLQLFTITDWDSAKVVAESEGLCRKTIMILDRKAKTVTQTGTLINNDGLCKGFSSDPIQSYLSDGLDVINQ